MLLEQPARENGTEPVTRELVGRRTETEALTKVLRRMSTGRGAVLEITGDPGIGKTSLLGLLARRATAAGARVVRGHAVRGSEPGQLVKEVLAALGVPRRLVRPSASGLAADIEVRNILGCWAAVQGGVLLLDNLHLCDEQSARALARLLRTPPSGPFVLALAHRPRQSSPVLMEALDHGVETGDVIRLAPSPLGPQAVSVLVGRWRTEATASLAYASPDPELWDQASGRRQAAREPADHGAYAAQLHDASCGNPRMLRILVAARWDPDEWPLTAGPDRDGLRRAAAPFVNELHTLSPDATTSAGAAAVLGAPFLPDEVAAISGLGLDRSLSAFGELSRADLIRPLPWGGRYAFRHPVLGHVILEHASPALRLHAHQAALDLLTTRRAPAVQRARHAEHVLGSGSADALQALIEGAEEAMADTPASAARWLRLALDHLPAGTGISATRAVLALDCCRALTAVGRLQEARTLAHDLLRHRDGLSDELRARAYAVCGEVERLLGHYQEAEAFVQAALDLLPRPLPVPLPAPAAELITAHGRVQIFRESYGQARELVREAAAAADSGDPMAPYLRALAALGDTQLGLLDEAAPEVSACARIVDGLPDATAATMPEVLGMLGCTELFHERFADAYRHLERGLLATTGATRRYIRINQLVALCHLDQMTGSLERLCRRAREAESLARMIGADEAAGLAMTLRAIGQLWTRPHREAARLVETTAEGLTMALTGDGLRASVTAGLHAHVQFHSADPAGCLRTLVEVGGPRLLRMPSPWRPSLLALASTAALRCGDAPAARAWAAEAETAAGQSRLPVQWQHVHRAQAEVHAAHGDHHEAATLFHETAESFRRAGLPVEHAWTLVTGAHSAATALGVGPAQEWLDEAAKAARACGAQRILEEIARTRKQLAVPRVTGTSVAAVPVVRVGAAVALLTNREREIAALAATGKRTKDIAEQLYVSTRTVETHLGSIYRKLDIRSRAALLHTLSQTMRPPTA